MDKHIKKRKEKFNKKKKNCLLFYFVFPPKEEPETRTQVHVPAWEVIQMKQEKPRKGSPWVTAVDNRFDPARI